MLEGLEQLLELQRLDDELNAIEEERAGVPERRERIEAARAASDERISQAVQALAAAEAAQRQTETLLQDREALLRKLEGQQFQVKSNAAYTALLHEMDAAKQEISDCETRLLEGMDAIESARSALERARAEGLEAGTRCEAEVAALDERERALSESGTRAREGRDAVRPQVEPKLLEQYEKIAARRRPAVVLVSREMCEGCRVGIPPQAYIEIVRGERVVTCGNCHRILLPDEKLRAARAS